MDRKGNCYKGLYDSNALSASTAKAPPCEVPLSPPQEGSGRERQETRRVYPRRIGRIDSEEQPPKETLGARKDLSEGEVNLDWVKD